MDLNSIYTTTVPFPREMTVPPCVATTLHELTGDGDFWEFFLSLHRSLTRTAAQHVQHRYGRRQEHWGGSRLSHDLRKLPETGKAPFSVPSWAQDQRNQMTGPADDLELCVKMLNSGSPGVMLDLEDSMRTSWSNMVQGLRNVLECLHGTAQYQKGGNSVPIANLQSPTVIITRLPGLHLQIWGIDPNGPVSAAVLCAAYIAYHAKRNQLKHPLTFYIPKSEFAEEAKWWGSLFHQIEEALEWFTDDVNEKGKIRCFALVESFPIIWQLPELIENFGGRLLGLNLGRWDFMASLAEWNIHDADWLLPDRNTIPFDVSFFQVLRRLLVKVCHSYGILAIGGMTALYPSRTDAELNARALEVLARDKKNESDCGFDGAWTGHPDQNAIAVAQFPEPNQLGLIPDCEDFPDFYTLAPTGVGTLSLAGVRAAVRTIIRYRIGWYNGKGASLLDGYMEDLATDRIYRILIEQRWAHAVDLTPDDGTSVPVTLTTERLDSIFQQEVNRLISELPGNLEGEECALAISRIRRAAADAWQMIFSHEYNPA